MFYTQKRVQRFSNLKFDAELWDEVLAEITSIYDQQHPVQPRKLRPAVQILKSSLAFLFENKNAKFSHLNLKRV